MSGNLILIIEKDADGFFAYCPALKGCQTQGDSFEEAYSNLLEAVDLYVETLDNEEKRTIFKTQVFTTNLEVAFE